MFHSNDNKDNKAKKYHRVSVDEAKANPEYWLLTQTIFREQAARIIQRRWRENHNKEFKGKAPEEILTTEPLGNRLRFLKEAFGEKASEHADKIKQGAWLELDFNEPEFSRNIYKACREGKITVNETATAILLHAGREELQGSIRQYRFDEAGPYGAKCIKYMNEEQINIFNKDLSALPQSEQCYFTINFSREYEFAFLSSGISLSHCLLFKSFYIYQIKKSNVHESEKNLLIAHLNEADPEQIQQTIHDIKTFLIQKCYEPHEIAKSNLLYSGFKGPTFIASNLIPSTSFYPLLISPDYNENDPDSPLLCIAVPTISAYNALQIVAHGEEHATMPFFITGKFPARLIRTFDERPATVGRTRQCRPVELVHPDLVANLGAHDYLLGPFSLAAHDLFLHIWTNGANLHKSFFRYLRNLLHREKGFTMSKWIWKLTDMDTPFAQLERMHIHQYANHEFSLYTYFMILHLDTGIKFWEELDQHDHNLLLIVDMIINREIWKKFIGMYPEELFDYPRYKNLDIPEKRLQCLIHFQDVFAKMKNIIDAHPPTSLKRSTMFYILYYRLLGDQWGHGPIICKTLDNDFDLKNILVWYRNEGLFIRKTLTNLKERAIEKIAKDDLVYELTDIGMKLEEAKLEEPAPKKGYSP